MFSPARSWHSARRSGNLGAKHNHFAGQIGFRDCFHHRGGAEG